MSDLNEAFIRQKVKELEEYYANRPAYLVVRRTVSKKVHPSEMFWITYDESEALADINANISELDYIRLFPKSACVDPVESTAHLGGCV